jgi:hypothetical protein
MKLEGHYMGMRSDMDWLVDQQIISLRNKIIEDLSDLGIDDGYAVEDIHNQEIKVIFKSKTDMNLYKLIGKYREGIEFTPFVMTSNFTSSIYVISIKFSSGPIPLFYLLCRKFMDRIMGKKQV